MGQHNVARGQAGAELLSYVKKRLIIGDKNLQVIAHLSQFCRCADEIRDRTRSSVPDEYMKTFSAQNLSDAAPNNPKADYPHVLFCSSGHSLDSRLGRQDQPA